MKFKNILLNLVRIALGVIFIYAAIPKILRPDEFADAINNYRILPYFLVNLMAICLPYVELLIGIFLIFGFRIKAVSFGALTLMVIFIIAVFSAWIRGIDINCGCFGTGKEIISYKEIIRDIIFLLMAFLTFLKTPKWHTL
jgi:uncharacterized membrane protein YphA (DoxX/SURF4 family)